MIPSRGTVAVRKILSLAEPSGTVSSSTAEDRSFLSPEWEMVQVANASELLRRLGEGGFAGVYLPFEEPAAGESSSLAQRLGCSCLLLDHYPDGVAVLDKESTVVWVNQRLADWFSGSPMVGRSVRRLRIVARRIR
jgi:hypothetical protein